MAVSLQPYIIRPSPSHEKVQSSLQMAIILKLEPRFLVIVAHLTRLPLSLNDSLLL